MSKTSETTNSEIQNLPDAQFLTSFLVDSLRAKLYPRYLEGLQVIGIVEISHEEVMNYGGEVLTIKLVLKGFEHDPWDLSRVCNIDTIGSTIEDDDQLLKELSDFLDSFSQPDRSGFYRERQLCFQQNSDTFHRLIFTIEIE